MARDPGEWYEERRQEAELIADLLAMARAADPPDLGLIRRLTRALERARYVGD